MKQPVENRKTHVRFRQTIRTFFTVRSKGGEYREQLEKTFLALLKEPCAVHWKQFGIRFGVALFGSRLINAVLSDRIVVRTGVIGAGDHARVDAFYHFAPTDCVERILSCGLQPKKHYVFLTDQPQRIGQTYLPWKTLQLGKQTAFTLLKMDAAMLCGMQKVFCTDREHEFVTGKIDAKLISVVPDDADASDLS